MSESSFVALLGTDDEVGVAEIVDVFGAIGRRL